MVKKHVKLRKTNEKRCVGITRTFAYATHKKMCKYYACTSVVFVATISHKILCDIYTSVFTVYTTRTQYPIALKLGIQKGV